MKILIVGGTGMLGHRLFMELRRRHRVAVTVRLPLPSLEKFGIFDAAVVYDRIDLRRTTRLYAAARNFQPDVIINAVGLVKQLPEATKAIPALEINALLPHRLAAIAADVGARLIHFSTDCVFSGRGGNYSEDEKTDADDLYGRSKLLGELDEKHCVTLRTSLIGHELDRKSGLVEWFLAQKQEVRGFRKAVFSGFTTIEMARIVELLLTEHPEASGVWHVSSEPIDKYNLLMLLRNAYQVQTRIMPDDEFRCDRSLDSTRFRTCFRYQPPSWGDMIREMAEKWDMET